MIDPLAPVLPAPAPVAPESRPPRYLTVLPAPTEDTPRPLRRVVRADGLPLGTAPTPILPEAMGLRLFDGTDGPIPRWLPAALVPPPPAAKVRRPRQPKPPADPDAPVFAPDQLRAARDELGISQRDLAAAIGTNRGQLAGAEAGTRHLSPYAARRLAQLLAEKRARKGA